MYIVQSNDYSITSFDYKFFEPGHSYNACDQDFGLIEKRKWMAKNVCILEGCQNMVAKSSKKFSVIKMDQQKWRHSEKRSNAARKQRMGVIWSGLSYDGCILKSFAKPTLQEGYDFCQVNFLRSRPASSLTKAGTTIYRRKSS